MTGPTKHNYLIENDWQYDPYSGRWWHSKFYNPYMNAPFTDQAFEMQVATEEIKRIMDIQYQYLLDVIEECKNRPEHLKPEWLTAGKDAPKEEVIK